MPRGALARIKPLIAGAGSLLRPLPLVLLGVALSGLYLALPARNQMNATTAFFALGHIAFGLIIVIPAALALLRLRRESPNRFAPTLLILLSSACLITGIALLIRPLIGQNNANAKGIWNLHLLSGVAGILAWGVILRTARNPNRKPAVIPASALLFFGSPFALWAVADSLPYNAANYARDISATNPEQANNPLFPAEFRLQEGQSPQEANRRWNADSPEYCGRAGCHAQSLKEWRSSAHALSAADPFYQQVKRLYANRSGAESANWCAGCHEPKPALTPEKGLSGSQKTPIFSQKQPFLAPKAPLFSPKTTLFSHDLALNQSVDCTTCHAQTRPAPRTGNARYTLFLPDSYPFAEAQTGWKRALHEFLIRLRPAPHQFAFSKPARKTAELCGGCHRQSFCVAQNQFQFVRGADNYGEWRKSELSGAIGQGLEPAPASQKTCIECHSAGKNVHSLPGANTALVVLSGDAEQKKRIESFLKDRLEIDIFALRHSAPDGSERWIAPLNAPLRADTLRPGEPVTLEVVVRNKGAGHDFPSGYDDLKAAWIEITIADSKGEILLQNGVPTSQNDLPPKGSHDYRLFALDRAGNPIIRNNRTEQVATLYRRSIPAGGADLARYAFALPKSANVRYPLRISAALRYRSLRPDFEAWVLNGSAQNTTLTLATATSSLSCGAISAQNPDAKAMALRFARYGSALLAPADNPELQRAQRAFRIAQSLAPNEAFPYLGLANAYLREPALLDAKREFENALQHAPNSAPAQFGLGAVSLKQGQFSEALERLKPLAETYPNDNALLRTLGTTYYQQGDYEQATTAFQRALSVDPDDRKAHFQLKLAYQRLQKLVEAHREDAILQYHAEVRQTATLRLEHLRLHPDMLAQARSLPEHSLYPPITGRDSGGAK